uniref:Uncharacterized protein n=1 Tax=Candidatus Kentrum sp. LFY TaxID=2126342 RepID=A0A450U4Y0_9GAMM|nr:MAG: hypothetical protein BECKLFY1418B_GA0070995_100179 [Candidatus Kentron sp. LFY]
MGSMANAMNEFYRDRISSRRFPTGTAPWKRPTNPRHCCVLATTSNHQGASSRFVIVSRRCRSIAHEILDRVIEKPPSKNRHRRTAIEKPVSTTTGCHPFPIQFVYFPLIFANESSFPKRRFCFTGAGSCRFEMRLRRDLCRFGQRKETRRVSAPAWRISRRWRWRSRDKGPCDSNGVMKFPIPWVRKSAHLRR